MLGMIIGVATVIVLTALGLGARGEVEREIARLGTNLLSVQPVRRTTDALRSTSEGRHRLTEADARSVAAEAADVDYAVPVVSGNVRLVSREDNWPSGVLGTYPDYLAARDWQVRSGRNFTMRDVTSGAKVALLGKTVAEKLSPLRSLLGQIVRIDGVPFRVIGILEEKGESVNGRDQDNVVIAPISAVKARLLGGYYRENRDATAFVLIKAANEKQMDAVEESVRRILRHRHGLNDGTPDDFSVRDPVAALSASKTASETMTVFLACIAGVSLLVGGISIMNIMLVSVAERSREIGIRMVVGADQADVRMQFLVEAAGVALVGGAIGVGFGLGASLILEALLDWRVDIEPWVCLGALAFAAVIGLASGMYPAYRASALDPMDAVRQ